MSYSYPSEIDLSNYGTQISRGLYARKLYNDESEGLTIMSNGTINNNIDILCGSISGSITLGSSSSDGNIYIQKGTLSGEYISSKSFTDGISSLIEASLTSVNRLASNILTDGTASLSSGSFSNLLFKHVSISSISDTLQTTTLTDNTAILSKGTFTDLLYTKSNTFTDGTLLLNHSSITNIKFKESNISTISNILYTKSLTDNTTLLNNGSLTEALYIKSNVITDGTITLSGSISGSSDSGGSITITNDGTIFNNYFQTSIGSFSTLYGDISNISGLDTASITDLGSTVIADDTGAIGKINFKIDEESRIILTENNNESQQKWLYDSTYFASINVSSLSDTTFSTTENGSLTLDIGGDIIFDAWGSDIIMRDDGTQFLKFTDFVNNAIVYNGAADKDIIFKDIGSDNEIMRIDGGEEALILPTNNKLEIYDSNKYISNNGSILSIISGNDILFDPTDNLFIGSVTTNVNGSYSKLEVASHDYQQAWIYDTNNYASLKVNSTGDTTFALSNSGSLTLDSDNRHLKFIIDYDYYIVSSAKVYLRNDVNDYLNFQRMGSGVIFNIGDDVNNKSDLIFNYSDNTEIMRLKGSNSYVGIGTTSPDAKLTVLSNDQSEPIQKWNNSSSRYASLDVNSGGDVQFRIENQGKFILNVNNNSEIEFKAGGNRIASVNNDGLLMESNKQVHFGNNQNYIASGSTLDFVSSGLNIQTQSLFKTTVSNGDYTINASDNIIFDLSYLLIMRSGETYPLTFRGLSSGDWHIASGTSDKDINFNVNNTDVMKVQGSTANVAIGANSASSKLQVLGEITTTSLTDGTISLYSGSISNLNVISIDNSFEINGSVSSGVNTYQNYSNIFSSSLTSIDSIFILNSDRFEAGSLTGSKFINSNVVKASTLSDGIGNISAGSISEFNSMSITKIIHSGTITASELNIGGLLLKTSSLTGAKLVESNLGSFSTLYTTDLFLDDDMVVNGKTTYANTSQISFEDKLISLGATDGRSIASISSTNDKVICCETDASSYISGTKVLCMNSLANKEILEVDSVSNNEITLTTSPSSTTQFICIIKEESDINEGGIEMLASSGTLSRIKTFNYISNSSSMEIKTAGSALDLRLDCSTQTSYYCVYDGSNHNKLLTTNGLFLNTSDGTITNNNNITADTPALYLSRNGDVDDSANDWRIRVDGTGNEQLLTFEQYSSTNGWEMQWQLA